MEQKHLMMWSTVGLGLGLGLGFGLATGGLVKPSTGSKHPSQVLEDELHGRVLDGKDSTVSFDQFPYYLNEQTRVLLTNAAFVHLKQPEFSRFISNLAPASPAILLTGHAGLEPYHQLLAKALARHFEAKLLLLDVNDFISKVHGHYVDLKCRIEPTSELMSRLLSEKVTHICSSLSDLAFEIPESIGHFLSSGVLHHLSEKHKANLNTSLKKQDAQAVEGQGLANLQKGCYQGFSLRRTGSRGVDNKSVVNALFKILASISKTSPVVLYLRDVENFLFKGKNTCSLFRRKMKQFSGPVLILGSRILKSIDTPECNEAAAKLESIFPYTINIKAPEDGAKLISWRNQLQEDMKSIEAQDNRNHILEVLGANNVECDDLESICFNDTILLGKYCEEIVLSAISHHLMNTEDPEYRSGRLFISSKSLAYGLNLFQAGQLENKDSKLQVEANSEAAKELQETSGFPEGKPGTDAKSDLVKPDYLGPELTKKADADGSKGVTAAPGAKAAEVPPDNEFEKRIRPEVLPADKIGVSFEDIGALDNVKDSLQELVMLPLQRPDLFNKGGLIKPCRGILLFGPPGTGKTMLAKAVATEAGASFINVSMSSITSKWFGEDEKNVRALFTLAAKVSPTIIFIDEVDSMLGQRSRVGEHEAMRKIKNEFMAHWDGLLSKGGERVLVLAATNRPFDLDDAIVRRFERRILVGLPDARNRENILRRILSKEHLSEDFDFPEIAAITEGYSGSDLKNLCTAAAYWPVRDLLKLEKQEAEKKRIEMEQKQSALILDANSENPEQADEDKEAQDMKVAPPADVSNCSVLSFRPLTMEDMRKAKSQISASYASEGAGMAELQEWNDLYGEGGSRKKQQLTYFI